MKKKLLKLTILFVSLLVVPQLEAQVYETVYETNFQDWPNQSTTSRVCVQDGASNILADMRNMYVDNAYVANASVLNPSSLSAADFNGAVSRGGSTNWFQFPTMTFNNNVRVTFIVFKETNSTGRNWELYYNQEGVQCSRSNDIPTKGTSFFQTGELPGYEYKEYVVTQALNGDHNLCLYANGSSNYFSYIKIETESKGPIINNLSIAGVDADYNSTLTDSIHVTVPFATDLSSQLPVFTLSPGTSFVVAADETTPKDFTNLVTYDMTDGVLGRTYKVVVDKIPASKACDILTFSMPTQVAAPQFITASGPAKDSIIVTVPYSTTPAEMAALKPVLSVSPLVSAISPDTSLTQDFSSPVTYTITAEDVAVSKEYVVRVKRAPASTACSLLNFKLLGIAEETVVFDGDTVRVTLDDSQAAALASLVPNTFVTSPLVSSVSPLASSSQDFNNVVDYIITAEDGTTTKKYSVKVTLDGTAPVLTNSKPALDGSDLTFSLAGVMKLGFDEFLYAGAGTATLSGGPGLLGTVTIVDSIVKIVFSGLTSLTPYTLTIPAGMFTDKYGNEILGATINFKTADGENHAPYFTAMDGENFDVPAFISPSTAYVDTLDVKATSIYQYGAYKLAPGETLTITTDMTGQLSVNAKFYAPGSGVRDFSIGTNTENTLGNFVNYDNNGVSLSQVINTSGAQTQIYIRNTSVSGDIYIPYISLVQGAVALEEQCQ